MKFQYYVLNADFNKHKIVNYNIFNNVRVNQRTEKAVRKYLRAPSKFTYYSFAQKDNIYGFEGFCKELSSIIACEEWGRSEYEIMVGDLFAESFEDCEKWDCWMQCKPNIEIIAREVIHQYKEYLKIQKET